MPNAAPSVFGFAVGVHPPNARTAWFVPAVADQQRIPVEGRFVVSRTRDGGETFEVLRRGLPDGEAYEVVYRHGLDVDDTGDRLAMGSTTGSLWVTEDQGESWATSALTFRQSTSCAGGDHLPGDARNQAPPVLSLHSRDATWRVAPPGLALVSFTSAGK